MPAILQPHVISGDVTISKIAFAHSNTGESYKVPVIGTSEDVRSCDLSANTWDELLVEIEAQLPPSEFKNILPPGSDPATTTAMTVAVSCTPTRFKRKILLKPGTPGRWLGDFILRRADVKKAIVVSPRLVRTVNIPGGAPSKFAARKGALIGEGEPSTLYLEAPRDTPFVGEFDVSWEDFRNSPASAWRRSHSNDLMFVEFTDDTPRLLLNERFAQLKPALESRERGSPDALLRDASAAGIGQFAWFQMFVSAMGSITEDASGEPMLPAEEWKLGLVVQGLRVMYPDVRDQERLAQGYEDFRSPEGIESFVSRAGTAAQVLTKSSRLVDDACLVATKLAGQAEQEEE
jgi:hypothetical protein